MRLTPVHKIKCLFSVFIATFITFSTLAFAKNTITQHELDTGNTFIKQKKFFQAIVYYKKLEVQQPTDSIIKNNLAVLRAHSGNIDNAILLLKQALNSNEISNVNYANLISLFEYQTSIAYSEVLSSKQNTPNKPTLSVIYKLPPPIKPKIIIKEVLSEPKIIIKEVIKIVKAEPEIIYIDVIKEIPAEPEIIVREVIKEVPAEPEIIYREIIKEIPAEPQIIYKEVIREVIKIVEAEPRIIYRDVIKEIPAEPEIIVKEAIKTVDVNKANEKDNSARLIQAMKTWKTAWTNQSSFKYINSYVKGYKSSKFNTHNAWKAHRIKRITKPDFINIQISNIRVVNYSHHSAKIKFTQHYRSDNFEDTSSKILVFKLVNGKWKITSEISL